ncbi:hypothetical protein KMP13_05340 [Epibacterium ulvae]|uniref:glycerophosphodiester phosphodiesterase family protein n=1 Tax=Epibacterium ulvae TaxID=1156985 RepID=UPI001BFC52A9|nr:glycerophosphodiester phosphodiesterase family protein [Epibacterium ulvae]MBT8153323.1 hypothetical protein [Epibacterium ulvae]
MSTPLIFGHRGAPAVLPENTLAGFQHTMDAGADGIELDVLLTRDGVPVVTHNPRLAPDTTKGADGTWLAGDGPEVAALSLAELQGFDIGACHPDGRHAAKHPDQTPLGFTPVPSLDAVLAQVAAYERPVQVLVELKHEPDAEHGPSPDAFVDAVAAVVARHGVFDQSYIHSFNWQILSAAARVCPNWRRSHLSCGRNHHGDGSLYAGSPWLDGVSHDPEQMLPQLVDRGAQVWSPFYKDLTPEHLMLAQSLGLQVMTWTVNGTDALRTELDRGVDGVITDNPRAAVSLKADKV